MMSTGGQYGEPWRTMAPPNGGVLLRMGQDDLTLQSVQIFPKEKGERIKECVNACAGMEDPEKEIADLRAQNTSLFRLLADIRAAAGDPSGRLMQDELVEHIRKLKECARIGDVV